MILHRGVRYEERDRSVNAKSRRRRTNNTDNNDPRTPQPWLPRRTRGDFTRTAEDFRPYAALLSPTTCAVSVEAEPAMPPEIAADAIAGTAQDTSASKSAQGLFFIFFPPFWRDLCFESNSIMVYLEGPHRIWRVFR